MTHTVELRMVSTEKAALAGREQGDASWVTGVVADTLEFVETKTVTNT